MKNNRISKKFNRKTKLIMLVSAIAIAILTVGYATFTTTLNIGNTTASIPAGTNNLSSEVVFGNSSITTSGAADAGSTVGTASGQTWNSSTAVFTSSIRSIVFTAPVYNNSAYDVYLTSMQSVSGAKLSCTNGTGDNAASSDLFDNFCNNTKATYSFGGTTVECDVNRCKTTLNSYELVSGGGTSNVTLTVSTLSTSTSLPDGQISISIPGITIGFSTTVDTNLSATNYVSDLTTDDNVISATITMASGVSSFGLSTDSSTEPTTWLTEDDNGTLTGTTWNLEYTCDKSGTYYLWIKDSNGNITKLGSFVVTMPSATKSITTLASTDTTNLATDTHGSYTNVRYIGANPNNYACFDDGNGGCINYNKDDEANKPAGLFRIIGVFNEDTHGQMGKKLIKLISADMLGNTSLPVDYKQIGVGSNKNGYDNRGTNDWSDSQLMYMLNGYTNTGYTGTTQLHTGYNYNPSTYYVSDGTYNIYQLYNGLSYLTGNGTTSLNIPASATTSTGYTASTNTNMQTLTSVQASMITTITWHLGGVNNDGFASNVSGFYTLERGTTVRSGYPTIWTGKIGLLYPSDIGYATSKSTCINNYYLGYGTATSTTSSWENQKNCYSYDWLFYMGARTGTQGSMAYQWAITPHVDSSVFTLSIRSTGSVYRYTSNATGVVRPSFYLNSNVYIAGGTGTSTDPYRFAM